MGGDQFGKMHVLALAVFEIICLLGFAVGTDYAPDAKSFPKNSSGLEGTSWATLTEAEKTGDCYSKANVSLTATTAKAKFAKLESCLKEAKVTSNHVEFLQLYGMFQDVHVMIFIGFGFLMTFMKRYSFSSVGFNFILSAITIQYAILMGGCMARVFGHAEFSDLIEVNMESLIVGDFAAAAVLISFGALLGKASLEQLMLMVVFEIIFFALNENIGVGELGASDMGGSMFVHAFGAYFGLAASAVLTEGTKVDEAGDKFGSNYTSDIFAMVGTVFLWMFWPSFNGALAGEAQERVVVNTVLSLTGSCISAFLTSKLLRDDNRFDMVDIQNATLAGGVAVGTAADFPVGPAGALVIGILAGILSVVGYVYVSPFLEGKGLHDTCGVHNLHGMPGVLGGITGAIALAAHNTDSWGEYGNGDDGKFALDAGKNVLALGITLVVALVGGAITGAMMKLMVGSEKYGEDAENWTIEEAKPVVADKGKPDLKV